MRAKIIERYDQVLANCPRFDRKGKTMPYTSANGHMFSQINKDGELGIRFAKEKQEKYIRELDSTYFTSYGAVMKGYVLIPDHLWEAPELIEKLLNESYDYVMTLKPK